MTILRGQKIILRSYRQSDLEPLFAGSNEPVGGKFTGTQTTFTREQVERYVQKQIAADDDSRASFIIAPLDDSRPVGEVVINQIDRTNNNANIRIAIFSPDDYGGGYGTEAMRLMVDYGFRELKLHRIELGVYAFNPRAIRVYEKVGFKREGVLRDILFYDREYHDEIVMSILEYEWAANI
jgi:RimJ/RimL family protein N-acetyltransferase